jgi:hypothetical protein
MQTRVMWGTGMTGARLLLILKCPTLTLPVSFDRPELPLGDVGVFGARDWPRAPAFEPRFDLGKIPDDASG